MEQRRTQRYQMQLPLQIIQVGSNKINREERTRDISSGGVCFQSAVEVELGGRIEYVITLSGSVPPVRIRCLGKVIRSEKIEGEHTQDKVESFEIAVTMERYQFVTPQEIEVFAAAH